VDSDSYQPVRVVIVLVTVHSRGELND
jgi:hypothetical protein